jgi:hypothetical protein
MLTLLIIDLVPQLCFYFIHLKYILPIHHLGHKHEVKCKVARYIDCHVYFNEDQSYHHLYLYKEDGKLIFVRHQQNNG